MIDLNNECLVVEIENGSNYTLAQDPSTNIESAPPSTYKSKHNYEMTTPSEEHNYDRLIRQRRVESIAEESNETLKEVYHNIGTLQQNSNMSKTWAYFNSMSHL